MGGHGLVPARRQGEEVVNIRDAVPGDFAAVLALNLESVHFLSPMDRARLAHLHAESRCHRVAEDAGGVAGFLLAFAEGADYDSPNYRWFASRYPAFLYIDRVVVAGRAQGRGVGRALYEDLFRFAATIGAARITCEFDVEPPNPVSAAFHRRFGFVEVGTQVVGNGNKRVSLQSTPVLPARASSLS